MPKLFRHSCILILSILAGGYSGLLAQSGKEAAEEKDHYRKAIFLQGDTLPEFRTGAVVVGTDSARMNPAYKERYKELKPKVIEVYPYAEVAGLLLQHYEKKLEGIDMEAREKFYMKKVEEDLKAEFKSEITDLSVSEGRVLVKLIDRETGHSSYEIIEELRGKFPAVFWQGVASVFGHDLKARYDPLEEDRIVEDIILDIKRGELKVPERRPNSEKVRKLLKDHQDRGRWWKLKNG